MGKDKKVVHKAQLIFPLKFQTYFDALCGLLQTLTNCSKWKM